MLQNPRGVTIVISVTSTSRVYQLNLIAFKMCFTNGSPLSMGYELCGFQKSQVFHTFFDSHGCGLYLCVSYEHRSLVCIILHIGNSFIIIIILIFLRRSTNGLSFPSFSQLCLDLPWVLLHGFSYNWFSKIS